MLEEAPDELVPPVLEEPPDELVPPVLEEPPDECPPIELASGELVGGVPGLSGLASDELAGSVVKRW